MSEANTEPSTELRISYLADTPEIIPLIAKWQNDQWGYLDGAPTFEQRKARLKHHLGRTTIPITFVAWKDEQPVGCASLVASDMKVLTEWSPWLASVYVLPDYRHQGIGSQLVQRVAIEAARLDYPWLYLYTEDQMHLYERLGWQFSHQRTYRGYEMIVMARDLIAKPPPAAIGPLPISSDSAHNPAKSA